jgi:GSCFA family
MEFRTEILTRTSLKGISLSDKLVTIGSCFADDIGGKLRENKFNVLQNPFGTVFNPVSIHRLLTMAVNRSGPEEDEFVKRGDYFYHHDFHSDHSGRDLEFLKTSLERYIQEVHQALMDCQYLVITLGTAWVYERIATKNIVANCHKVPQDQFKKLLLTQKRIVESFEDMYAGLKILNPSCQIILTVSPVRHIKDTLELNSVSKSILRVTCHTLSNEFKDVEYFPAYEIMMDDLRDYRFYKPDMIHPTDQAIEYIWEKFTDSFFDSKAKGFVHLWKGIQASLKHQPFQYAGKQHQKFLTDLLDELLSLNNHVDVGEDILAVKLRLEIAQRAYKH